MAMTIPSSTPNTMTPTDATNDRTNDDRRTRA